MEQGSNKSMVAAIIAVLVLVGGGIGIYALTQSDDDTTTETSQVGDPTQNFEEETVTSNTIVDLAVATPELSTLVAAVTAAELVDILSSEGPFTVFAPTNAAFDALPEGTLESLLEPENLATLQAVLTYHVVSGAVFSSDLSDGQVITTVQGNELTVRFMNGGVMLEDVAGNLVNVVTADVEASNGVVHIIDGVVLPE